MRIKILVNFNGNVNGTSWRFRAGEERDVPDAPAMEFVRGKYAVIVGAPAVKIAHKPKDSGKAVK